jgi:two-component system CheB/CheR fusion protein
MDLVSCRNLLIYLDAAAQRRVMQVFHYALRPHGFLMLGRSESVGHASDLFKLFSMLPQIFSAKLLESGIPRSFSSSSSACGARCPTRLSFKTTSCV